MRDQANSSRGGAGRRAAANMLTLVCVLAVLTTGGVMLRPAVTHAADGDDVPRASLAVTAITPAAPTPDTILSVSARVTNISTQPLTEVTAQLGLGVDAVGSRSQLAAFAAEEVGPQWPTGEQVVPVGQPVLAATFLPAGASEDFVVSVDTDELNLGGSGVYPLTLGVRDDTGPLTTVGTFLPWSARPDGYDPTSLVWMWPLVTAPRLDATGELIGPPISQELGEDGRLGRLADVQPGAGVTWVVDPDLLETVDKVAAPASTPGAPPSGPSDHDSAAPETETSVASDPSNPPGPGTELDSQTSTPADQPASTTTDTPDTTEPDASADPDPHAAAAWLQTLRTATLGQPLLQLPPADPDLTAVQRAGRDGRLAATLDEGEQTIIDVLGRTSDGALAWPADGMLNPTTATALARADFTGVVLDPATLPTGPNTTYTPTGRVDVRTPAGRLRGVVADPVLSTLAAAPQGAGGIALAVQRFLAETAMITAERPNQSRTVLVLPPREWDPDPGLAEALLDAVRSAPWVHLIGLPEMLTLPAEQSVPAGALVYPAEARAEELPANLLAQLSAIEAQAGQLSSALSEPEAVVDDVRRAADRLTAVHWRSQPQEAARLAARLAGHVDTLRASLRLQAGPVVLSGRESTFPVTVVNDLDQQVRVRVRLAPDSARIRLVQAAPVTVAAHRRAQVNVPVEAVANGEVIVTAQLATPTGHTLGPPVRVPVRVAQIGPVGLVVTLGAAVVLFAAAGAQLIRRARHHNGRTP